MTRTLIAGGHYIDVPSLAEIREAAVAQQREMVRGIKVMRIPQLSGTPAGSALSIGAASQVGPESGYAWSLTRAVVSGLTSGATPDVVNLYANDASGQPLWQFNGNNFGYSWVPGGMVIYPGEVLFLKSVGTFAATGTVVLSGQAVEVPAEKLALLVVR